MFAPSSQPAHLPVAEQRAQFHRGAEPKEFRFHARAVFLHYFAILEDAFLALRFGINSGNGAGGRSSTWMWSAKRSLPIWQVIVEVAGSSGGFGNGNTLFLRSFITTLMPRIPR
jgi:hypothetical protein